MMKRLLFFTLMTLLFLPIIAKAQGPVMWQDLFEDDDPPALKDVGWIYYGEGDGLSGSVVEQRSGELFLQAGSYGGLVGAVIVETNGVPEIAYDANGDPTPETVAAVRKNTYSDSNQVLTFQLNFKKVTSSFFVVATRMVFDSDSLDSDPTASPAYALLISPLEGKVGIAKYEGDLAVLDPTKWNYFGMGAFPFTMDVYYWVKLYLNQADMKVKVWEGELTDEPEAWLLEGVDPTPRLGGTFTAFGLLNPFNPIAGDQMVLDNITVSKASPVLWEDAFDDDDLPALKNVGWIYYGEGDGLSGSVVEQRSGELFLQAGSYGGLVGAVIVETNGVPEIAYDENGDPTPETVTAVRKNSYSNPNQIVTFQLNFKKLTSSFFVLSTRMVFDDDSLDSDPTTSPAYALLISPLEGKVGIAKYEGELTVLDPTKWNYFGMGAFPFTMEVYYWVKLYLNEGDMKVKVWEGEPTDEPEAWLVEGVDPAPRVDGTFTAFGLLNPFNPIAGDQMVLDNISVSMPDVSTKVEPIERGNVPTEFALQQNFPNPFNSTTEIRFNLSKAGYVNLLVYNALGQIIATLVDGEQPQGSYRVQWNAISDNGAAMPSGVYFYRLQTNEFTKTMKMILMK